MRRTLRLAGPHFEKNLKMTKEEIWPDGTIGGDHDRPQFEHDVRLARGHSVRRRILTGKHAGKARFPRYNRPVSVPGGR